MRYINLTLAITLIFLAGSTSAKERERWQDARVKEMSPMTAVMLVPPFCQGQKVGIHGTKMPKLPPYQNKDWYKEYGGQFTFINHYCGAKPSQFICYSYPEREKNECVASLIEHIDYALKGEFSHYALYSFLMNERADVLSEIGNLPDAILNYQSAIKNDSKFAPAYLGLANTYIKLKKYDEAEKTINDALTHNPQKKSLLKKLEKINKLKNK